MSDSEPGKELPEEYRRELPVGWPLGGVEFTQGMVWGTPSVIVSRQALSPKRYRACETYGLEPGPLETLDEVVGANWDPEERPPRWSAVALTSFAEGDPIGILAGLLRDDVPEFWARLDPSLVRYTARFEWRDRKLVVDASEYGNLVRFVGLTDRPANANVRLELRRCICRQADPTAVLVAVAAREIAEGESLVRLGDDAEVRAAEEAAAEAPRASIDWTGWSLHHESGMTVKPHKAKSSEPPIQLFIPILFLDIVARDPSGLRDEMCMHKPTPKIRIWEIDDPTHPCFNARGIKATERIAKGDVIGTYTGFVTCTDETGLNIRGTYTVAHNACQRGDVIDGYVHGNEIR
jgi:hypothetical protein